MRCHRKDARQRIAGDSWGDHSRICGLQSGKGTGISGGIWVGRRPSAYASLEEMLENEQVDVLHICTPHYLHTPMAVYALEKGVHVFTEKPPAISRDQFATLKAAAKENHARLGICFQNRYNESTKAMEEILASGENGKIVGARAFVSWMRTKEYYAESDWRGKWETEGGGCLINQSVHTLDLLNLFMGGQPVETQAHMMNYHLKDVIEVEDTVSAYIRYPDAAACFSCHHGL